MSASIYAPIVHRLAPTFRAHAHARHGRIEACDFEQSMWEELLSFLSVCGMDGRTFGGEILLERTDSYIADWAAGRARKHCHRAATRQRREADIEAADAAGACSTIEQQMDAERRTRDDLLVAQDDEAALIRRAARLSGGLWDDESLQAAIDNLSNEHHAVRLRRAAFLLLRHGRIAAAAERGAGRRALRRIRRMLAAGPVAHMEDTVG